MPLSQYKRKELYRHVESFELADPSFFEDAVITENLSICVLKTDIVDKYSWEELQFMSFDRHYKLFYEWNVKHNKGLKPIHKTYSDMNMYNINTYF